MESISLIADGKSRVVATGPVTVSRLLQLAGVNVDADDEVSPPREATVSPGATVRVTRVRVRYYDLEEDVPYRTIVRPPASRRGAPYHPTVTRKGRNGRARRTFKVVARDGAEGQPQAVAQEVVREPVHQVVTARRPAALGNRGLYTGRRSFECVTTAYDPGPGSCGPYANGRTANGTKAGKGVIAVDPRTFPLGVKMYVPGYGVGITADVGGAIKGNKIDLCFRTRREALRWGRKKVRVVVLEEPDPNPFQAGKR